MAQQTTVAPIPAEGATGVKPRWWSFRIWTGMRAGTWWRMVARHGFRISPSRLGQAASMLSIGPMCSAVAAVQRRKLGAAIGAETPPPVVFILGHWRSGTTFLHELMGTDQRFIAPTSLECFATDHYLRWGDFLASLKWAIPAKRPMDDMAMGWHRPQEDEFALFAMGVPSPYDVMAFPNDRPAIVPHLHVGDMRPAEQAAWKEALRTVVKRISYGRRRALKPGEAMPSYVLLKSPTHTARIGVLAEMFPDAKFIHIARDPHEVYASTERLWRATFDSQGLQKPDPAADLSSFILGTLPNMYRDFDRDVAKLAPGRWTELRYEDLVADPVGKVGQVTAALGLGPVDEAALAAHLAGVKGHRRNRHVMDPALAARIRAEWAWYFERFGYAVTATGPAHPREGGDPSS
ncbi:MAG: sulfotransferase [Bauldia sp.]|nr:sulfotransferase [Bauldia sp.]